jgi:hypothetical protein
VVVQLHLRAIFLCTNDNLGVKMRGYAQGGHKCITC